MLKIKCPDADYTNLANVFGARMYSKNHKTEISGSHFCSVAKEAVLTLTHRASPYLLCLWGMNEDKF